MKRAFLTAAALGGLAAVTAPEALAAPSAAGIHVLPTQPAATQVDYYWHHHRWHHHHWHYWD